MYTRISNKMQRYTVYIYLESVLRVSGGTSTNHQERIQLYVQHLVFVTPLLLSADIAAGSSNGRMEKISWTDHVRNEDVLLTVKEQRNILH